MAKEKVNGAKCTGDIHKECLPVTFKIPQAEDTKLELHPDRRLNWRKHIFTERKQLGIQLGKMYWLVGSESQLSTESRLHKAILKPIWAYSVQLWGTASGSNMEILQRFQKISDTSESSQRILIRHQ